MNPIEQNIETIKALCNKYMVAKLFVFGSVLTEKFNAESDIDLVVDFDNVALDKYADNYFDFKFSLQDTFHRNIDLLEEKAIRNPYMRQSIDSSKRLIYAK
jgi:predicted nucleotidyltransferase